MSEDKPLHVRVAEALGWTATSYGQDPSSMLVDPEGRSLILRDTLIADPDRLRWFGRHYDTDWSATGPLIEKYGISVDRHEDFERLPGKEWMASAARPSDDGASGSTPLIAVCNLILALHKAGKL